MYLYVFIYVSIFVFISMCMYWAIGLMNSVHHWYGRPGFNPRSSHTKTQKMVLDTSMLNTQHFKVRIKGKVEQFREWSSALPYTSV